MNYEMSSQEMEDELAHESLEMEDESAFESEDEQSHESLHEDEMLGEDESLGEDEMVSEYEDESLGEDEDESMHESLHEAAHEQGEQFLGSIVRGAASLLGEGEDEFEGLGEYEDGEQFFKKAFRGIGRIVKTAAPLLGRVAKIAAPLVAKAVGGALGGPAGAMLASKLASTATRAIGGGGFKLPFKIPGLSEAHEFELQHEANGFQESHEFESHELEFEAHELESHEAQAELMAHFAAQAQSEFESEAFVGGAVTMSLSRRDRAALRRLVPGLIRGAAILTRVLRMQRTTRPMVRVVPTIIRRTARTLVRGARSGRPISRNRAAQVMAGHTRRVLSSPLICGQVLQRNLRVARPLARPLLSGGSRRRF
jgi:hypothetical protein